MSRTDPISQNEFTYEIDPKCIQIQIIKYIKRYFTDGSYLIEIQFKQQNQIDEYILKNAQSINNQLSLNIYPTLQIKRTYDDFWAFHEALKSKFKNIKFQDLPKKKELR